MPSTKRPPDITSSMAVLGKPDRMVERRHQDVGAEPHAGGPRREAREHRQRRGPVVIGDRVVLFHPDGVEAELLGARDLLERLPVVVPALDGDEADLESGHYATCRWPACRSRP